MTLLMLIAEWERKYPRYLEYLRNDAEDAQANGPKKPLNEIILAWIRERNLSTQQLNYLLDQKVHSHVENVEDTFINNAYYKQEICEIADETVKAQRRETTARVTGVMADLTSFFVEQRRNLELEAQLPLGRDLFSVMFMGVDPDERERRLSILKIRDPEQIGRLLFEIINEGEEYMKRFATDSSDAGIASDPVAFIRPTMIFGVMAGALEELENALGTEVLTAEEKEELIARDEEGASFTPAASEKVRIISSPYYELYDEDNLNRIANVIGAYDSDSLLETLQEMMPEGASAEEELREKMREKDPIYNICYPNPSLQETGALLKGITDLYECIKQAGIYELEHSDLVLNRKRVDYNDRIFDEYAVMKDGTILKNSPALGRRTTVMFGNNAEVVRLAEGGQNGIPYRTREELEFSEPDEDGILVMDDTGALPEDYSEKLEGAQWRNRMGHLYRVMDDCDHWFQNSSDEFVILKEALEKYSKATEEESGTQKNYAQMRSLLMTCRTYMEHKVGKTLKPREVERFMAVAQVAETLSEQIDAYRLQPMIGIAREMAVESGDGNVVRRAMKLLRTEEEIIKAVPDFRMSEEAFREMLRPERTALLQRAAEAEELSVQISEESAIRRMRSVNIPENVRIGRFAAIGEMDVYDHLLDNNGAGADARAQYILRSLNLPARLDWKKFTPETSMTEKMEFLEQLAALPVDHFAEIINLATEWGIAVGNPEEFGRMAASIGQMKELAGEYHSLALDPANFAFPVECMSDEETEKLIAAAENGNGMNPEQIRRMKEFFHRVNEAAQRSFEPKTFAMNDLDLKNRKEQLPEREGLAIVVRECELAHANLKDAFRGTDFEVDREIISLYDNFYGVASMLKTPSGDVNPMPGGNCENLTLKFCTEMNRCRKEINEYFNAPGRKEALTEIQRASLEHMEYVMERFMEPAKMKSLLERERFLQVTQNNLMPRGLDPDKLTFRDMDGREMNSTEAMAALSIGDSLTILDAEKNVVGSLVREEAAAPVRFEEGDFNVRYLEADRADFERLTAEYPDIDFAAHKEEWNKKIDSNLEQLDRKLSGFSVTALQRHRMLSADRIRAHIKAVKYRDAQNEAVGYEAILGVRKDTKDPYSRSQNYVVKYGADRETQKENIRRLTDMYRPGHEGKETRVRTFVEMMNGIFDMEYKYFTGETTDSEKVDYFYAHNQFGECLEGEHMIGDYAAEYGVVVRDPVMAKLFAKSGTMPGSFAQEMIEKTAYESYLVFPAEYLSSYTANILFSTEQGDYIPDKEDVECMNLFQNIHSKRVETGMREIQEGLKGRSRLTEADLNLSDYHDSFLSLEEVRERMSAFCRTILAQGRYNERPESANPGVEEQLVRRAAVAEKMINDDPEHAAEEMIRLSSLARKTLWELREDDENWSLVDRQNGFDGGYEEALRGLTDLNEQTINIAFHFDRIDRFKKIAAQMNVDLYDLEFYGEDGKWITPGQASSFIAHGKKVILNGPTRIYRLNSAEDLLRYDEWEKFCEEFRSLKEQLANEPGFKRVKDGFRVADEEMFKEGHLPVPFEYAQIVDLRKEILEGVGVEAKSNPKGMSESRTALTLRLKAFANKWLDEKCYCACAGQYTARVLQDMIGEKYGQPFTYLSFRDINGDRAEAGNVLSALMTGEPYTVYDHEGKLLGTIERKNGEMTFAEGDRNRQFMEQEEAAFAKLKEEFPGENIDELRKSLSVKVHENATFLSENLQCPGYVVGAGKERKMLSADKIRCYLLQKNSDSGHLDENNPRKYFPPRITLPAGFERQMHYLLKGGNDTRTDNYNMNRCKDISRSGAAGMKARKQLIYEMLREVLEFPYELMLDGKDKAPLVDYCHKHPILMSNMEIGRTIQDMNALGLRFNPPELAETLRVATTNLGGSVTQLLQGFSEECLTLNTDDFSVITKGGFVNKLTGAKGRTATGAAISNAISNTLMIDKKQMETAVNELKDALEQMKDFNENSIEEIENYHGEYAADYDEWIGALPKLRDDLKQNGAEQLGEKLDVILKECDGCRVPAREKEELINNTWLEFRRELTKMERSEDAKYKKILETAEASGVCKVISANVISYKRVDVAEEIFRKYNGSLMNSRFQNEKGEMILPFEALDLAATGEKVVFVIPEVIRGSRMVMNDRGEPEIRLTPELEKLARENASRAKANAGNTKETENAKEAGIAKEAGGRMSDAAQKESGPKM